MTHTTPIEYNRGMKRTMLRYAIAHIDLTPGADGYVSVHIMGHGIGNFTPKVKFGLALTNHLMQFGLMRLGQMRYTPQAELRLFGKLRNPLTSTPR